MKFWYLCLLSASYQSENIFKKVIAVFKKEVNFQSEFSLYVDPQFETEIIKGIISFNITEMYPFNAAMFQKNHHSSARQSPSSQEIRRLKKLRKARAFVKVDLSILPY